MCLGKIWGGGGEQSVWDGFINENNRARKRHFLTPFFLLALLADTGSSVAKIFTVLAQVNLIIGYTEISLGQRVGLEL